MRKIIFVVLSVALLGGFPWLGAFETERTPAVPLASPMRLSTVTASVYLTCGPHDLSVQLLARRSRLFQILQHALASDFAGTT